MNMKRTIASMLTLALMTGYGAPMAAVAMAEDYDDEDIIMGLIIAGMLEEQAKQEKKSKKKSSTKKSTTKKSTTKKSTTKKSTTKKSTTSKSSDSSEPAYTLSDVTPYSGVVRTNGGSLNMRKTAGADSAVLMSLANGTFVTVNGKTSNGWLRVTVGNQTGFVSSRYITEMIEESTLPAPKASAEPAVSADTAAANTALYYVIANPLNNFVNMREGAGTSTPVIGVYHYGAVLKVLAIENEWSKVEDESNGKLGYIKSNQLQRTDLDTEEDHG